jgi:hypothetical protein
MGQDRFESAAYSSLAKVTLFLAGLGVCMTVLASACATGTSDRGGGSDDCNEDDVCDDEEDCDCSDCADTSACDGNGATGATSGATGATSSAATTAASSSSGGGGVVCADVSDTTVCLGSDPAACLCLGCSLPQCDDGLGGYNDCVCANCTADPYCSDPVNCVDDGECHPGLEGCICVDCVGHPLCQ